MIDPYFSIKDVTIYNGDCREIMPLLPKADIVITDPPYGISFQSNHRKIKHKKIKGDLELPLDLIYLAINKARRAAYIFCRWDQLCQMPKPKSVIAWVKNNWSMGDLKHEHGRQWEAVCFYPKKEHQFIKRIPDVIHCSRTNNKHHPTQKPIPLIEKIIAANVGETVLDPFMGSGSTLLAAIKQKRKAIGIEIDTEYCNVAIRRIKEAMHDISQGNS